MKKAIFAGTFDPFTLGHLSILTSALNMGFEVTVAVCEKSKSGISSGDRVEIVNKSVKGISGVKVESFDGFLIDFMKKSGASVLVRGLRNTVDFEYEKNLYYLYKDMYPQIEVCYLLADKNQDYVSSSVVREIFSLGGDASNYLSSNAYDFIEKLYKKQ